jgi:RIO kinase 1
MAGLVSVGEGGDGACAGSGARSTCAQPNIIAHAITATKCDGRIRCSHAVMAKLRALEAETLQRPAGTLFVMKIPKRLQPLLEEGLIDGVVRQLMSGKEAMVFVVRCGDEARCAKVYKEPEKRSFRQAVDYTENRKTKNTRQARAMAKGTRFGRKAQEQAWQSAEVDALYRLAAAGVRVPRPYIFHEGVLLMELVADEHGEAAPRLNDLSLTPDVARDYHERLIREVVRMLCAGVVHGDLSEFNILVDSEGPVIIDLPQAVDAAGNNHAPGILERDVVNLRNYFGRHAPELLATNYGKEIWSLYEAGALQPDTPLTGRFERIEKAVDLDSVLQEIDDARLEDAARRLRNAGPRVASKRGPCADWRPCPSGYAPQGRPGQGERWMVNRFAIGVALAGVVLVGCQAPGVNIDSVQPHAVDVAVRRAQLDTMCASATPTVVDRQQEAPSRATGGNVMPLVCDRRGRLRSTQDLYREVSRRWRRVLRGGQPHGLTSLDGAERHRRGGGQLGAQRPNIRALVHELALQALDSQCVEIEADLVHRGLEGFDLIGPVRVAVAQRAECHETDQRAPLGHGKRPRGAQRVDAGAQAQGLVVRCQCEDR